MQDLAGQEKHTWSLAKYSEVTCLSLSQRKRAIERRGYWEIRWLCRVLRALVYLELRGFDPETISGAATSGPVMSAMFKGRDVVSTSWCDIFN